LGGSKDEAFAVQFFRRSAEKGKSAAKDPMLAVENYRPSAKQWMLSVALSG
jgi:hypothetical protein